MTSLAEPLQHIGRTSVRVNGRNLAYFGGCDYFRLSSHPKVLRAARYALKHGGLNVAASRLTTGNHKLYGELETALEKFFDVPAATLAANGYAPNLMAAQALAGQYSHALVDEQAHGCLLDAAQLLDCPVIRFKHRNAGDVARILERLGESKPILLTDGMFPHNGSVAPLADYLKLLPKQGTVLLDDAHGAGVLGANGRGTPEHAGVPRTRIVQTITLSKAFGVFGGAVLGTAALKQAILDRSRLFIGSTPLPPMLAGAAVAAVNLLGSDARLRRKLMSKVAAFKDRLRAGGFPIPDHPGPIIAAIPRNARERDSLKRRLLAGRIHPPFIKYPGGPPDGYFRFAISSEHTAKQLNALAEVLSSFAPKTRSPA